ncbi:MAG: glycerophosphodiester phosphodiesterase [Candidatus Rokuibacteriota bacterium]|nr:MAG: glycerophosphodiester phosphodiesterase [Candidatus Rokubacteria bacterium]
MSLALAGVAAHGPAPARRVPSTLYAAHRGGALLWPENSVLAFKNAIALGADFIELDVHLSKDGEVVVIHDPTVDRTTTGRGRVRAYTLAELGTMRLKDRAGSARDERIPTLDEVAGIAAASQRRMLLEIKPDERGQRYPGIEEKVLAILDRHGVASSTVVMAFESETWRRVLDLRPDVAAGALYSQRTLRAAGSTGARELSEAASAGVRFVGLQHTVVGADAVRAARNAGVMLGVWTVNEANPLRRFIEQQVGVVITDRPDLAKELLGR